MSVRSAFPSSQRLLARLTVGALLGLGMLLGGCFPTEPGLSGGEGDESVGSENLGEVSEAVLAGEIELEDVDGDGDIDSDDVEELLLDLQEAARSKPGSEQGVGPSGEGNDPSPQPWHDDDDPEAKSSSSSLL